MSIGPFEAEARGMTREEDILTSRVFGILNRVDKVIVLGAILRKLGIAVPEQELRKANIRLWEKYDGTIPDAVIETDSSLIFAECKVDSPIVIEQLKREHIAGTEKGKKFHLICVTKDFLEPSEIRQVRTDYPNTSWISWQWINASLRPISESEALDQISKGLIDDLLRLLHAKGFRGFAGFKRENLEDIIKGTDAMSTYFNEISIFIRELRSQLYAEAIEMRTRTGSWFYRDGRGTMLDSSDDWIPFHLTFAFGSEDWLFRDFYNSSYLFVRFYTFDEGEILFGFSLRTKRNRTNIDRLIEKREEICEWLRKSELDLILINEWEGAYQRYSEDEIVPQLFSRDTLEDVYRTEFCHAIHGDDDAFSKRKMLEEVRNAFIGLKESITKLGLTPRGVADIEAEGEEAPQDEE